MSFIFITDLKKDLNDFVPLVALTPREIEVIQRVLIGKTAKHIARELSLSYRTVEQHVANIKRKFGCKTKLELASKFFY